METVLAILALAAFVAMYMLWDRAKGAMQVKLTRTVMSRTHEAGQAATQRGIEFVVACAPGETLLAIRRRIAAPEDPPALVADLYLAEATDRYLRYVIGSSVTTTATAVVVVTPDTEGGCRGEYRVLSWTEVDGLVGRVSRLERIATGVTDAVRDLDVGADIRVTTAAS